MFKPGDRVIRVGNTFRGCIQGEIYTVDTVSVLYGEITLEGIRGLWSGSKFELAKVQKKEKKLTGVARFYKQLEQKG